MINYGNHYTDKKDIQSVVNVLKNKNLTQGEKILEFENNLSKYFGSKFCLLIVKCYVRIIFNF